MILDKLLLMSNAQAITASANSTDVIDLGVASDIGNGEDIEILCVVGTAFTAAGAATLQVALQGSTDNSTFTDMVVTRAIGKADLVAGAEACKFRIPPVAAGQNPPRYLRMSYTVATGPMTAGTITAGVVQERQNNRAYAPGISISN
jgi:hypothetical protein